MICSWPWFIRTASIRTNRFGSTNLSISQAHYREPQALQWRTCKDSSRFSFRPLYQKSYEGRPVSNAIDILAGGLACFKLANGQPRETTIYATNLPRDTDCKANAAEELAAACTSWSRRTRYELRAFRHGTLVRQALATGWRLYPFGGRSTDSLCLLAEWTRHDHPLTTRIGRMCRKGRSLARH
jgi:hypothetical protein